MGDTPANNATTNDDDEPSITPTANTTNNNNSSAAQDGNAVGEDHPERPPWPVGRGSRSCSTTWIRNLYQQWSFSYMNPILSKGQHQFQTGNHLVLDDLYQVPDEMRADHLVSRFWELYQSNEGNNNKNGKKSKKKNARPSLIATLLQLAAPAFVPAGVWEFLYMICRVTLPVSLHFLLQVVERQNNNSGSTSTNTSSEQSLLFREGFVYALTLSVAAFLGSISQNQTIFLSAKSGIMIRSALTVAIYKHALNLTPRGREGLTTGEITNLVAVDTQKLYDVMIEGHNLWSCPMLACVVTILLWLIVGPELMIGVAVLILFLPVVKRLVQRMLRIRRERSSLTDQRINILSAMLEGIRVTKLNHYESKVEENVGKVRDQEMALLRRELRSE